MQENLRLLAYIDLFEREEEKFNYQRITHLSEEEHQKFLMILWTIGKQNHQLESRRFMEICDYTTKNIRSCLYLYKSQIFADSCCTIYVPM